MIDELLNKSLDGSNNSSLKEFLQSKLEVTGLSKTQFEKLANLQRRSLDGILDKSSKQTDVINLLKLGEFLDLTLEELIVYHM